MALITLFEGDLSLNISSSHDSHLHREQKELNLSWLMNFIESGPSFRKYHFGFCVKV